jgi:hypothetical protein
LVLGMHSAPCLASVGVQGSWHGIVNLIRSVGRVTGSAVILRHAATLTSRKGSMTMDVLSKSDFFHLAFALSRSKSHLTASLLGVKDNLIPTVTPPG